jgi:para-nitrobenzyl esterase
MNIWSRRLAMAGAMLVLLGACVMLRAAPIIGPDGAPMAQTRQGRLSGVAEGDILHFRGVPFAKPPVGDLRWKAPQAPAAWSGVRQADMFGPACMQRSSRPDFKVSEDCLTLNVSTTTRSMREGGRPVLVRIHGGGFVTGSGAGEHSADVWTAEDVVLVTFNYRLGALGVFAHPLLAAEEGRSGSPQVANFALLDMKAALEWVKSNIAQFGGDPQKVTISGVSAGGEAVQLLLLMPDAQGLFARAIASSGYIAWPLPEAPVEGRARPPASRDAVLISEAIASRAAGGRDPDSASALRALPAESLVQAVSGFHLPIIDGRTVPGHPVSLFEAGMQAKVPLMTGGNSYEGSVFPASGVTVQQVYDRLGDLRDRLVRLYASDFSESEDQGVRRMFGDMRYVLSSFLAARAGSEVQPVYLYYVDYVAPERRGATPGTPHAGETPLLERGGRSEIPDGPGGVMRDYWVNFIRTGDPNGPGLGVWPRARAGQPDWMRFGDDISAGPVLSEKLPALAEAEGRQRAAASGR